MGEVRVRNRKVRCRSYFIALKPLRPS